MKYTILNISISPYADKFVGEIRCYNEEDDQIYSTVKMGSTPKDCVDALTEAAKTDNLTTIPKGDNH